MHLGNTQLPDLVYLGLQDRNSVLALQLQLVRRLPFCLAELLGTHNSAISLADGYGNRDEYFQQYFKWIRWVVGVCRLILL